MSDNAFDPLPVLRPRQQVENQLRKAILNGTFQNGDRLPSEMELAAQFKVSRATVREALRGLAEGGLISKVPGANGGSFVQLLDHHTLTDLVSERMTNILDLGSLEHREVAQFRDLLEVPSARMAAANRTDKDLAILRAIIEREKVVEVSDPTVATLNAEFHSAVALASGNRVVSAFVTALHRVAHPLAFIDTDEAVGQGAVRHHIEIYRAIEQKQPEQAAERMRNHLAFLNEHAIASGTAGHDGWALSAVLGEAAG